MPVLILSWRSFAKGKKSLELAFTLSNCANVLLPVHSVVYFEMEEFESAKTAFSQGLKLRQEQQSNRDTAPYARYIRKCNAEMAGNYELAHFVTDLTLTLIHYLLQTKRSLHRLQLQLARAAPRKPPHRPLNLRLVCSGETIHRFI